MGDMNDHPSCASHGVRFQRPLTATVRLKLLAAFNRVRRRFRPRRSAVQTSFQHPYLS